MKIRNAFLYKTAVLSLAVLTGFAGTAFAAEADARAAEAEVRTIGTDEESAVRFELTNKTGKDITFISFREDNGTDVEKDQIMKVQEALIEQGYLDDVADGSFGPNTEAAVQAFREENGLSAEGIIDGKMLRILFPDYEDGNLLSEKEVIKADETVAIFIKNESGEPIDPFLVFVDYDVVFKLEGDEAEYALHDLTPDRDNIQVMTEGDVAYIMYQAPASELMISTYETEKAIKHPSEASENEAQGADGCIDNSNALINP